MIDKIAIARESLSLALSIRSANAVNTDRPICPIDLCQRLEIDVRFTAIPSLEGMYASGSVSAIVVSSLRPAGRRRFTCAHELGHHLFGHGDRLDEVQDKKGRHPKHSVEEFAADMFAGHLLMTKKVVLKGFCLRNVDLSRLSPIDVFHVSGWLGVGYSALIQHMAYSLHLITERQAANLLGTVPGRIKSMILGHEHNGELFYVDANWVDRPVDVEVGDLVVAPYGTRFEGHSLIQQPAQGFPELQADAPCIFLASQPGIGRLQAAGEEWAAYVRCSRKAYVGRGIFRHLPDDEEA